MFFQKKLITLLLLSFLMITNSFAENKIVYIDLEFILSNSETGKKLLHKLKESENNMIEEFKTKENNLKNEENKILASRNIISKDAFDEKVLIFQKELEQYKKYKSEEIDNLKKNRDDEIMQLINKFKTLIEDYMKENSITMIIDRKNIFIGDKNYDITNKILAKINNNIQ